MATSTMVSMSECSMPIDSVDAFANGSEIINQESDKVKTSSYIVIKCGFPEIQIRPNRMLLNARVGKLMHAGCQSLKHQIVTFSHDYPVVDSFLPDSRYSIAIAVHMQYRVHQNSIHSRITIFLFSMNIRVPPVVHNSLVVRANRIVASQVLHD
jgi:hypothetical protein